SQIILTVTVIITGHGKRLRAAPLGDPRAACALQDIPGHDAAGTAYQTIIRFAVAVIITRTRFSAARSPFLSRYCAVGTVDRKEKTGSGISPDANITDPVTVI